MVQRKNMTKSLISIDVEADGLKGLVYKITNPSRTLLCWPNNKLERKI